MNKSHNQDLNPSRVIKAELPSGKILHIDLSKPAPAVPVQDFDAETPTLEKQLVPSAHGGFVLV